MLEIKEDFQLFIQTDLSKAEKLRAIKEVIDNFSEIVEEHLRKERLVSTPFGKFGVKVNKRFGTKGVYFEVNSELKKYLHDNSDKNVLEIEKQRKTINKNLVSKKKYLDRHKPKQKEDE